MKLADALRVDVRDALVVLADDLATRVDDELDPDERGRLIRLFLATTRDLETLNLARDREARLAARDAVPDPSEGPENPLSALVGARNGRTHG